MPTYVYSNNGIQIEFKARMGCAPQALFCHGMVFTRDIRAEHCDQRSGDAWVGHSSMALMVHPADIPKYMADARKKGVRVSFDPETGWAHFNNKSEWKCYNKAYGFHGLNEYDW